MADCEIETLIVNKTDKESRIFDSGATQTILPTTKQIYKIIRR